MNLIKNEIKNINRNFSRIDVIYSTIREDYHNLISNLTNLFEGKRIVGRDLKISYCLTERVFFVCYTRAGKILFSLENRNKHSQTTMDHIRLCIENLDKALIHFVHSIEVRRPYSKDIIDVFNEIIYGKKGGEVNEGRREKYY